MAKRKTLITGAAGYLGRKLASRLLDATDEPIILWVRASCRHSFQKKREELERWLGGGHSRLVFAAGDLGNGNPYESLDPGEIGTIIHAAAVTSFNVDEATANAVNVEGTEKTLHFADRCPALERFVLVSTVYSTGLAAGPIPEAPSPGRSGFANHYERSKWSAEDALVSRFDHLPWSIHRVATAICDDRAGQVTQYNAFHNTLKLFYYGLLSVMPGKPDTPLYFVSGDFVACAQSRLIARHRNRTVYHICHTASESPCLDDLVTVAFETFHRDPGFRRRRVLKPLYSDEQSFRLLADGMATFGQGIMSQAVSSVSPFAPQLFISKIFDNSNLVGALPEYEAPHRLGLVRNTCAHLVATKWGRDEHHL